MQTLKWMKLKVLGFRQSCAFNGTKVIGGFAPAWRRARDAADYDRRALLFPWRSDPSQEQMYKFLSIPAPQ